MLITMGFGEECEQFTNDVKDLRMGVLNAEGDAGILVSPPENTVEKNVKYGAKEEYIGSLEKITIDNKAMVSIFNNDRIDVGVR
jgi:hypothetical protein